MSKENSYIRINQDYSFEEEKSTILLIIDDIYKLEEKIEKINETLNQFDKDFSEDKKLNELKNKKNKLLLEISENKKKLSLYMSNNNIQIKSRQNELNNIEKKINELKNILNSYNQNIFKSNVKNNNFPDEILSNNDLIEIIQTNENIKLINIKEQINKEKKLKEEIINKKNKIISQINEINENLRMIKEEKNTIKNELVNYISYKETLESIIKTNIHSILINVNNYNNNNIYKDYINENKNSLCDNNWSEILQLYPYEFFYLNPIKCSVGITNDIFDLLEPQIKKNNNKKEENILINTNRSTISRNSNLNTNYKSSNDSFCFNKSDLFINKENYNIFNLNKRYALQNLLQIELNNVILDKNNNINKKNDLLKNIANKIVLKINEFGYNEKNIYINLNNLMIYLSFYLKKMFYESIISIKLKIINKDYKTNKKEFNKSKLFLMQDIKKYEENINDFECRILSKENELKLIENNYSNGQNININNVSIEDKDYIQICNNIHNLIEKKNVLLFNIEKYEKNNNLKSQEINLKISQLLNEINEINNEINRINNYIKIKKDNLNKNILDFKNQISEKYNDIKACIQLYKNKCGKNIIKYNIFIDNLKKSIKYDNYNSTLNLEDLFQNNEIDNKNSKKQKNFIKFKKIICGDLLSSRSFKELTIRVKKNSSENSIISNKEKYNLDNTSFIINNKDDNEDNDDENNSNYSNISLINNSLIKNNEHSDIRLIKNIPNLSSIKNNNKESNFNVKLSSSRIPYPNSKRIHKSLLDSVKIKINDKNQRNNRKNIFINSSSIENFKQTKASNISVNNSNISENQINYNTKIIFRNQNKNLSKSKSCLCLHKNFSFNNIDFYKKKSNNNDNKNKIEEEKYNFFNSYLIKQKNIINYKSSINDIFFNDINPLLKKTFCYYRVISHPPQKKFNPLKDISSLLCNYPYNYIKSTISLSDNYDNIKIIPSSQLENIIYPINVINNTEISSIMKIIIEINRNYRKYKCMNNNWNKDEFILGQRSKYLIFEDNEIEKCCYNKYYNFFVILLDKKKIEFLFSSYEEFKIWINGISFIIKNKNEIIRLIDKRKKYVK